MKHLKHVILAMLAVLCVVVGGIGLFGCATEDGSSQELQISDQYKAIYQQYSEAAGSDAKSLEDWYVDITGDITALNGGEITEITVITVDSVKYVSVTFTGGKLYLEPLTGGDFKEYVRFTVTAQNEQSAPITTGVNLEIYYISGGEKHVARTIRTGARGTAEAYLDVSAVTTFYVGVAEQSKADYGIPYGDEPVINATSAEKSVTVTLRTPVEYTVTVQDNAEAPVADVEISLQYAPVVGTTQAVTIQKEKTGADGTVKFLFVKKDVNYQLMVTDTTIPDTYEKISEPIALDFDSDPSSYTISLKQAKKYATDVVPSPNEGLTKPQDYPRQDVEFVVADDNLGTLFFEEALNKDSSTGIYTYNDRTVYVALGYATERALGGQSISEIIADETTKDYFSYEVLTDEDTNTWTRHLYYTLLSAYCAKTDSRGLYPLDDALLDFLKDAGEHGLFKASEEVAEGNEWALLLVTYDTAEKLAPGAENGYTVQIEKATTMEFTGGKYVTMPVVQGLEEGWYKLSTTVDTDKIDLDTIAAVNGFVFWGNATDTKGNMRIFNLFREDATNKVSGYLYYNGGEISVAHKINEATGWKAGDDEKVSLTFVLEKSDNDYQEKQYIDTKGEFEIPVYPSSWINSTGMEYTSPSNGVLQQPSGNLALFGSYLNLWRGYVSYEISVTLPEGVDKVTAYTYNYYFEISSAPLCNRQGLFNDGVAHELSGDTLSCALYTLNQNVPKSNEIPGFTLVYDGDEIVTAKVKVVEKPIRYLAIYDDGAGNTWVYAGSTYQYYQNGSTHMVAPVSVTGFQKEGYLFDGWLYTYEGLEEPLPAAPNDRITVQGADLYVTAQWRKITSNTVENKLGVGADGKVTAALDNNLYTETVVPLADGIEAGSYVLTVVTGDRQLTTLSVTLEDWTCYFVESVSEDGIYTYTAFLTLGSSAKSIVFPTMDAEFDAISAQLTLTKYEEVTLAFDDTEMAVPVNQYVNINNEEDPNLFKVKLPEDLVPGTYKIDIKAKSSKIGTVVKALSDKAVAASYIIGGSATGTYTFVEGEKSMYFFDGGSTKVVEAMIISMHRVYNVTYAKGDDNATGTTAAQMGIEEGATVTVSACNYTWKDHTFFGWKYVDGNEEKTLIPGDKFEMPAKDVVLTAVWREIVHSNVALVNGAADFVDVVIDATRYTDVVIQLGGASGSNGTKFKYTADFGKMKYDGLFSFVLPLNQGGRLKDVTINLVYSEAESYGEGDDRHNIYIGYVGYYEMFTPSQIVIDLSKFANMEPFTFGLKLAKQGSDTVLPGGKHVSVPVSGNLFLSFSDIEARFAVSNIWPGAKYKLHVLKDSAMSFPSLKGPTLDGEEYINPDNPNEKIYPIVGSSSTAASVMWELYTSTNSFYAVDVWIEIVPDETATAVLEPDTELKIKVPAGADGATFKMGAGMMKATNYTIKATLPQSKTATITLKTGTNYTLNDANGYMIKQGRFTDYECKITTDAEEELEITLYATLYEAKVFDTSDEGITFTIPRNNEIDTVPDAGLTKGTNQLYKVWFETDGDAGVITFKYSSSIKYEFTKENGYKLDIFKLETGSNNYTVTCTSSTDEQVTLHIVSLYTVNMPSATASNQSVDLTVGDMKANTALPFALNVATPATARADGNIMYKFTLSAESAIPEGTTITLKYDGNDQSLQFVAGGEGYILSVALENQLFSITSSAALTGVKVNVAFVVDVQLKNTIQPAEGVNHAVLKAGGTLYALGDGTVGSTQVELRVTPTDNEDLTSAKITFTLGDTIATPGEIELANPVKNSDGTYSFYAELSSSFNRGRFKITSTATKDITIDFSYRLVLSVYGGDGPVTINNSANVKSEYVIKISKDVLVDKDYLFYICKDNSNHTDDGATFTLSGDIEIKEGTLDYAALTAETPKSQYVKLRFTKAEARVLLVLNSNSCGKAHGFYINYILLEESTLDIGADKAVTFKLDGENSLSGTKRTFELKPTAAITEKPYQIKIEAVDPETAPLPSGSTKSYMTVEFLNGDKVYTATDRMSVSHMGGYTTLVYLTGVKYITFYCADTAYKGEIKVTILDTVPEEKKMKADADDQNKFTFKFNVIKSELSTSMEVMFYLDEGLDGNAYDYKVQLVGSKLSISSSSTHYYYIVLNDLNCKGTGARTAATIKSNTSAQTLTVNTAVDHTGLLAIYFGSSAVTADDEVTVVITRTPKNA